MSADNGIYILKTPRNDNPSAGFEYRVAYCSAIDNIFWDNDQGNPEHMLRYFGKSQVFNYENVALAEARRLYDEVGYTEYGIQFIDGPIPFSNYVVQAYEDKKSINSHMVKRLAEQMDLFGIKSENVRSIILEYVIPEYDSTYDATTNFNYRLEITHNSTRHMPID